VLHTLRGVIGDAAFFRSIRREVYGRVDPAPGNFQPRFGSTNEFVGIVNQESKRDLGWFFDVYLRQAKLPLLVDRRDGSRLILQWRTPRGLPFPMPVEVAIDGMVQTVAMTGGKGELTLPSPRAHVTIDPQGKLLRQSDEMDRFRDFTEAAKTKAAGGKS
jgi:aminopeptidase N